MESSFSFGAEENDGLEALWEDGDLDFCRGWRANGAGGRSSVLVVLPTAERPQPAAFERIAHEYELRDELEAAWAARPLELVREAGRTALLLEDPGGEPLARAMGGPMEADRFLRLAIGIAAALGKAHQRGLVHKDIKPANILVNCADGLTRLTGFGIASRLPRERQAPEPPEVIAGTLAYMAPEQTGRMNRSIDSRSDFYALGVTFYEMLSGVLPFNASNPLEWVHCHVARQPVPVVERTKTIPAPLSAIVMKLLSKTADDRYQTAAGLEWDLRRCLADWEARGRIDAFPLGTHDRAQQLLIPEKLYGRDVEIRTLLQAFERVVTQATPELVLVSGYAGIGKSSVVNELHKVIVPPRGMFISGKYDQRLRDTPYATFAQAFQGLIRQILAGRDAQTDRWRCAIREAVGNQGALLTDLIPELTTLIGPQLAVPALSPLETQLRFQSAVRNFVGAFARAEHPLAIFLDDLHWLDPATLTVVESLITHPDTRHLLLIGAYRDNEVGPDHPLMSTLSAIRASGARVTEITLDPLSLDDFTQLISDAVRCRREQAFPLAALVHAKTAGNPFFGGQFLANLVEEGLVAFDPNASPWRWSLQGIEAKSFSENVVDLMVRRLQRLPSAAQEALKRLACLGIQADFSTLAKIESRSAAEVQADFADAVRAGAILSVSSGFKFLHDRVQEAAYALIPPDSRVEQHLRLGRLLWANMGPQEMEEKLFDVVNQLNLGCALILDREEQQRTAVLNLQAAKKAKTSTAYASACRYLAAATTTLGRQGWRDCYALTYSVWFERAECEFLAFNLEEAAHWIEEVLLHAQSKVDRSQAYRLRMVLQLVRGDNAGAVRTASECLQIFDIELPERPTDDQVQAEYDALWSALGAHPILSLVELPMMQDPEMRAVMNVYSVLCLTAYFTDSNLCQTIACRMVSGTLKHGVTDPSVVGYAILSIFLGPVFHRYKDGEEFARLALAVAERHGFAAQKAGAKLIMQMAFLWTRPIGFALSCLDDAISSAKETGEVIYACYSLEHRVTDFMARGDRLDAVWRESVKALAFVEQVRFRHVRDILSSVQQFIHNLRGQPVAAAVVEDAALEARLMQGGVAVAICFHWILQIQRHFLFGDAETALECAQQAKPLLWSARCHIQFANYVFYHSLALAAIHDRTSHEKKGEIRSELATNVQTIERWAQSCPETFGHKHLLVCAELARVERRQIEAMQSYERAARSAGGHGFIQDQALANELAGRCCLASGLERAAHAYLRDARDGYLRWGADGKVRQLDQLYPQLQREEPARAPKSTIGATVEHLDLATVIKVSQAVSGEIVLEKLIDTLMRTAIEQAGAERGLLILPRGDEQRIEAEATVSGDTVMVRLLDEAVAEAVLPEAVLHYVLRTGESVILDDAAAQSAFAEDPYIRERKARSVLCLTLINQGRLNGVLYLENNLARRVFTPSRTAVLKLLASQAAITLENTHLYRDLAEREARIRRREKELREVVETIPAMAVMTLSDGSVAFASRQWNEYTGLSAEDSKGSGWRAAVHPDDVDRYTQRWRESVASGEPFEDEMRLRRAADGEYRWFLARAVPLRDERGVILRWYGILADIEDRKRAVAALRGSEEQWKAVFENNPTMYLMVDSAFVILSVNPFGAQQLGYTPDELIGRPLEILFHPADREQGLRNAAFCLEHLGRTVSWELRKIRKDGVMLWVRETAKAVVIKNRPVFLTACEDITEGKRAAEALRRTETQLRRLIDANIIGIETWHVDGRILEANDAHLRILGYSREDLVSGLLRWTDLTPPESLDISLARFEEVKRTGVCQPHHKEYFRKDGSRVPVLIASTLLDEELGVSFVLDLTERRRAEDALRETQMQLAHANRIATMGQLVASIAHEVTQPIAGTIANAQAGSRWLGADPPNLDEARQSLLRIVRDGERAGDVVHRIRNLSKKATPRDERVDINAAIREVIELTRTEAMKNGVKVQTDLVAGLPLIQGDKVGLQQVLLNLILNALEAMSEMSEGSRELRISAETTESGDVLVAVRDSGPGLAPDTLERVFAAFHTTKPNGLGLGLSICSSIIEAHMGTLWASANAPRGAVFQFTLPAEPGDALRERSSP